MMPEVVSTITQLMQEAGKLIADQSAAKPQSACPILWDHIGQATAAVAPEETAFFWRKGSYVCTARAQWVDPADKKVMMAFVERCKTLLLPYALDGKAAYVNYIDSTVPNWEEAYYGRNYKKLQHVKKLWDPSNFFRFDRSIRPATHGTERV